MVCQSGALSFDVVPAVDTVTGIPVENAHTLILAAELVNFAVRLEQARAERQAEQGEYGRGSGLHGGFSCSIHPACCQCRCLPRSELKSWKNGKKGGVLSWKNGKKAHFCLGKVAEIG